jgi:hypothetical protein
MALPSGEGSQSLAGAGSAVRRMRVARAATEPARRKDSQGPFAMAAPGRLPALRITRRPGRTHARRPAGPAGAGCHRRTGPLAFGGAGDTGAAPARGAEEHSRRRAMVQLPATPQSAGAVAVRA